MNGLLENLYGYYWLDHKVFGKRFVGYLQYDEIDRKWWIYLGDQRIRACLVKFIAQVEEPNVISKSNHRRIGYLNKHFSNPTPESLFRLIKDDAVEAMIGELNSDL